jgi:DNA-binding MarR family transcriptional regulator
VKRLVEAGLLIRESRRGERGVFISPTKAGATLFQRLADQAAHRNTRLIQGLTRDELSVLSRVIDKLEANAQAMLDGEGPAKA